MYPGIMMLYKKGESSVKDIYTLNQTRNLIVNVPKLEVVSQSACAN